MTRIAVIGAGGIGCLVAAHLIEAGHDVTVCARTAFDRLTVETPDGSRTLAVRVAVDPAAVAPAEWVLLATKAHQTEGAAPWLARLAGPGGVVVVLQNGIGRADAVAPLAGGAEVLPVLVHTYAEAVAPGHVRHPKGEELMVPAGPAGDRFAALLAGSGLRVIVEPDFLTANWRKLLGNLAASPITALSGRRGAIMHDPDVLELAAAIMREGVAVAQAEGARLGAHDIEEKLDVFRAFPPEAGTSMLFDRLAGKRLEHEAITGAVVAAGARRGVPTPLNGALLTLLRAASDG